MKYFDHSIAPPGNFQQVVRLLLEAFPIGPVTLLPHQSVPVRWKMER
ncbi:hypothetical protein [Micromonospora sp. NPDC004551]